MSICYLPQPPGSLATPIKTMIERIQDDEERIAETFFVVGVFPHYVQVGNHCGDDHGHGMFDAVHREARARKPVPNQKNKTERGLQIHQAAKAGGKSAIHAFEGAAAQPAHMQT